MYHQLFTMDRLIGTVTKLPPDAQEIEVIIDREHPAQDWKKAIEEDGVYIPEKNRDTKEIFDIFRRQRAVNRYVFAFLGVMGYKRPGQLSEGLSLVAERRFLVVKCLKSGDRDKDFEENRNNLNQCLEKDNGVSVRVLQLGYDRTEN